MTSINYPSYAENTNTDNFQVVGYNETTQAVERKNLGSAIDAKIVASSGAVQSAYQLIPQLIFKWFDDNNNPANGWLVTSYEAGTTTPVDTYSDDIGTVNDNPITLDPRGEARIFLDSTLVYKFVITDALGGNVQTFDNITGVGGVSSGGGGGSVAGNVGDLQLNKDGVNFGASGLNWLNGVLTIDNSGNGSFTQDYSDLSKVTTTTAFDTGSAVQVVQSGAVSTTLTGSAGALALVSDATNQSITMDNVAITSDAQSVFGLGVTLGGGLGLVDGSVDYTGGVFRFRENGVTRGFNATSITYDNATSGLTATEVQSAIDELNANANTLTMETITTSETNTALVAKPDGVGGVTWGTDSALPAGSTTEIQVNVGGAFGAYSSLTYDGLALGVSSEGNKIEQTYNSTYKDSTLNNNNLVERLSILGVSRFASFSDENTYDELTTGDNLYAFNMGSTVHTVDWEFGDSSVEIELDSDTSRTRISTTNGTLTSEVDASTLSVNGVLGTSSFDMGLYPTSSILTLTASGFTSTYSADGVITDGNVDAVDGIFSGDVDADGTITSLATSGNFSASSSSETNVGYSFDTAGIQRQLIDYEATGMNMRVRSFYGDIILQVGTTGSASNALRLNNSGTHVFTGSVDVSADFTAGTIQADNGFTGTGAYTNFTIVGGVITNAS